MYGWQDTYVFTKAMGEMVINSMRGEIPVVTIRPSVIESTFKEPFPGWMEGNRYIIVISELLLISVSYCLIYIIGLFQDDGPNCALLW